MKLQFKQQPYQSEAVNAVVDVFASQPFADGITYRIDPGKGTTQALYEESGFRNAEIQLTTQQLLNNVHEVQKARGLTPSKALKSSSAAPINLDVEMETGTGKTYVYIRTILELNKRYGWSKFIIVVPSIAIREGVKKTFDITAEHFQGLYGTKPRAFVYNSSQLHNVESFSSDSGVQVMIINIQAFNARGADANRIYEELDDFQSRRPIDVIAANRPILIIDEPQKIGSDEKKETKSLQALGEFKALFALRYSATHAIDYTKVHRLDALDAYNKKLVKRIAVRGISVKGLPGSDAYLYLERIELGKGPDFPKARVEIQWQPKVGDIVRKTFSLSKGDNLHVRSNEIEAYRGLFITDIDANRDVIELNDGTIVTAGQLTEDVTDDHKRRIQIREVVKAHLDKERELYAQGVKVLSLFFIDEVAKYRDYSRDDTLGVYARVFEEEYVAQKAELLSQLDLDADAALYRAYLDRDEVGRIHEGYFSIDKKSRQQVDGSVKKTGESAGQSDDVDAYDLILKNKEALLSFDQPVRFIFSHSALREGWDNPNVFTLGMLKKSDQQTTRRQEIGRGLRISVDQRGERMDNEVTVHDVNVLTVVTDEAYTDFVAALQKEISDSLSARPRKATPEYFTGKMLELTDGSGERITISQDQAQQLQHWLTVNGYIDYQQQLTDAWFERDETDQPALPAQLEPYRTQIVDLIDALHVEIPKPEDGRKLKTIPLNDANFAKREFQELWGRINRKAVYQVEFDSQQLIDNCIQVLDKALTVAPLQYVVVEGEQQGEIEADALQAGSGFTTTRTSVEQSTLSAASTVTYDLLGEIAEKTQLLRRTCAAILTGVNPATFAKFRQNPEQFIIEVARLVNEQKATTVIEHLSYNPLTERHDSVIFTENQTAQDLEKAGPKLSRSVYEYVVTDSKVERDFVTELDTSSEVVVYAKLPRAFFIPTPVGNYNPDWAIAFREGSVKHIFFVAETKGSNSTLQLKGAENAKIESARRFFGALNESENGGVTYSVVTTYDELMTLVNA